MIVTDPIQALAAKLGEHVRGSGGRLVSSTINRRGDQLERIELTAAIDGPDGRWSFEMGQDDAPELAGFWRAVVEPPGALAPVAAGVMSRDPDDVLRAVFERARPQ
jgi:hypothetical protein